MTPPLLLPTQQQVLPAQMQLELPHPQQQLG
jgi:hypothetical protein